MARARRAPSVDGMTTLRRTFIALSLTCGAAWLLKQVAIVASGGGDAESTLIAALWATGMITFVLASATGTALVLRALPTWARVVVGIVAAPVSFLVLGALDPVVDAIYTADGWFAQEIPLVLAALVMAALGARTLSGTRDA
ncbi:hypothetical protein GCM10027448_07550 [Nocardioides dilutus]